MQRADIAGAWTRPGARSSVVLRRYFGARGPHLAAMLAYYALLSLFPFVFLAASLVSAIGRPEETSTLLRDLSHVLPGTSASDLARLRAQPGVERGRDRPDRRRRAAVVVARLPVGARIGPQRALRAPQPRLPAPEARRARIAGPGAARPAARPHDRGHEPDGALGDRSRPLAPGRLADRRRHRHQLADDVPLPADRLPHAAQHRADDAPGSARRADRDRCCCS